MEKLFVKWAQELCQNHANRVFFPRAQQKQQLTHMFPKDQTSHNLLSPIVACSYGAICKKFLVYHKNDYDLFNP